ncbi:SDR family oxidoreductase [Hydrogenophaga sp. T2]|uniref:SDR family oxidoreductase n=1 Tax=Hydrogenophaga sp. T2 TaxID=3132823 RepID=UPI003CF478C9
MSKPSAPAVQAGARAQPAHMPAQHIAPTDSKADLALPPRFLAPDYQGSHKLRDRVALITGGDSGIGRAVAVLMVREGADIAVVYLQHHDDAQQTQAHVQAEGQRCLLLPGDVRDGAFCRAAVQRVLDQFGRLDVLVNNAAVQASAEDIEALGEERWRHTFDTNALGYFLMTQAAVPHLKSGSAIVNTGSVAGLRGSGHLLDYAASKGAVHAFTKALAQSLIDKGIRVNAVAPGPVWTPLNPADASAEQVAEFGRDTDMKRAAQPEEISPAYVFLASPAMSGYITGVVLPVTGSVDAI